jgi:hypothetical protein
VGRDSATWFCKLCLRAKDVPMASTIKPITTVIAPSGLAYVCIRGVVNVAVVGDGFVGKKLAIVNI